MHYGHITHVPSPDDLTIMHCSCGWYSKELTKPEVKALGIPWYCGGTCGKSGLKYMIFHPNDRIMAHDAIDYPRGA